MANSSPPADGHSHQQDWTPVVLEYPHIRKPDGTPLRLHLHCRPNRPRTSAYQPYPTNTTTTTATTDRPPVPPEAGATKVVRLTKMLSPDDRLEDDEFEDLVEDVTEEARKFGNLVKVVIPRPSPRSNLVVAGVGKAFLEYACLDSSSHCRRSMERRSMDRRWFAGKRIAAGFYPEGMFAAGDYGYDVDCPEDDG